MKDKEIRTHFASYCAGAGIGIGMIVDALDSKIEPSAFTDSEREQLRDIAARVYAACGELTELAMRLKHGRQE